MRAQLLTQVLLPSAKERFLKYSVAPLYGQDRKIIGAVLAFHDDTLTQILVGLVRFRPLRGARSRV